MDKAAQQLLWVEGLTAGKNERLSPRQTEEVLEDELETGITI